MSESEGGWEMNIDDLIEFYSKYQEWYYKHKVHKYKIGDLIKLPIDHVAIGHRGQLGIIQGFSGIENYIYVISYDTRTKKYSVHGVEEDKLISPAIQDMVNFKELVKEFVNWTYKNDIKLATHHFKDMLESYKKGEDVFS